MPRRSCSNFAISLEWPGSPLSFSLSLYPPNLIATTSPPKYSPFVFGPALFTVTWSCVVYTFSLYSRCPWTPDPSEKHQPLRHYEHPISNIFWGVVCIFPALCWLAWRLHNDNPIEHGDRPNEIKGRDGYRGYTRGSLDCDGVLSRSQTIQSVGRNPSQGSECKLVLDRVKCYSCISILALFLPLVKDVKELKTFNLIRIILYCTSGLTKHSALASGRGLMLQQYSSMNSTGRNYPVW